MGTALVHVGTHKTGTTSLQRTYSRLEDAPFLYIKTEWGDHSTLLGTLFEERPERFSFHMSVGRPREAVLGLRERWRTMLEEQIATSDKDVHVYSAEYLSDTSEAALIRFRDFLRAHYSQIKVYGYVRPPCSYLQSTFQQRVKGALRTFRARVRAWPGPLLPIVRRNYIQPLFMITRVFGEEAMHLKKYDRAELVGGDTTVDFAQWAGLELPPYEPLSLNDGLPVEVVALMYNNLKFGTVTSGYENFPIESRAMMAKLVPIGTGKLRFRAEILEPELEFLSRWIDRIERVLGASILDEPGTGDNAVSREQHLFDIAESVMDQAVERLCVSIKENTRGMAAARTVDLMRLLIRERDVTFGPAE